jgi:hypothetical protein
MRIAFRSLFLTAVVALALVACAEKPEKKLIGKWGMDTQAALESEKFKSMPEDQKAFAKKMIEEMGSKMVFDFQEGGKVHVEMGEMKEDGEWSVKSVEGDKMVIHSKGGKPGPRRQAEGRGHHRHVQGRQDDHEHEGRGHDLHEEVRRPPPVKCASGGRSPFSAMASKMASCVA